MRLIILGAPGSGKGTQAEVLSEKLNVPHISTGDIFRANIKNGTPLGKLAKEYIDKGALVPDEVTIGIVKDRLLQDDCKSGFIMDGFPRTIPQAESFDKALKDMNVFLDRVLEINVSDEEIVKRLSGRRVCPSCGMSFHMLYRLPKKDGICDACGTTLIQRSDDSEATVLNRLNTYHEQTEPLIEYYKKSGKYSVVYGQEEIADTTRETLAVLGVK